MTIKTSQSGFGQSPLIRSRVPKFSRCWMYEISRQRIEQLGISFGFIFLFFPIKVAGDYAHTSWEKSQLHPALRDSPGEC